MNSQIQPSQDPVRIPGDRPQVRLGEWYWIDTTEHDIHYKELPSRRRLWCVVDIGSNHVKLKRNSYHHHRVHFKDFAKECTIEPNAPKYLREEVAEHQALAVATTQKIEELCRRLGLSTVEALPDKTAVEIGSDIVPASQGADIKRYKKALVKAQEKELPALFEDLKKHNENLARAMTAESMSLVAYAGKLNERLDEVKQRIFHVELYAGLAEEVEQVAEGKPAGMGEKIRVMQRRLYMDEECLLDYDSGGMNFQSIKRFDAWLARTGNRDRILPFPRCVVAFRVRRNDKEYASDLDPFIKFSFRDADAHTYLYLRNGENLYRLNTALDFGSRMFPGRTEFDFTQPVYAKMYTDSVDKIYTEGEFQELRKAEAARDAWRKANPGKNFRFHAPDDIASMDWSDLSKELHRFSPDDVYYDDIRQHFANQARDYNRIVVVLQGLLDRSPVFHPHPPLKLWKERDAEFICPVYDDEMALYGGPKPDFRAYQQKLNKGIVKGTMVTGQRRYWFIITSDPDKRTIYDDLPYKMRMSGDNGPSKVMAAERRRRGSVDFLWERERAWSRSWYRYNGKEGGTLPVRMQRVPLDWLLNVDAYTPGDFKQFFADPRTREEYLQWAGLLLTAEAFKSGKAMEGIL